MPENTGGLGGPLVPRPTGILSSNTCPGNSSTCATNAFEICDEFVRILHMLWGSRANNAHVWKIRSVNIKVQQSLHKKNMRFSLFINVWYICILVFYICRIHTFCPLKTETEPILIHTSRRHSLFRINAFILFYSAEFICFYRLISCLQQECLPSPYIIAVLLHRNRFVLP